MSSYPFISSYKYMSWRSSNRSPTAKSRERLKSNSGHVMGGFSRKSLSHNPTLPPAQPDAASIRKLNRNHWFILIFNRLYDPEEKYKIQKEKVNKHFPPVPCIPPLPCVLSVLCVLSVPSVPSPPPPSPPYPAQTAFALVSPPPGVHHGKTMSETLHNAKSRHPDGRPSCRPLSPRPPRPHCPHCPLCPPVPFVPSVSSLPSPPPQASPPSTSISPSPPSVQITLSLPNSCLCRRFPVAAHQLCKTASLILLSSRNK